MTPRVRRPAVAGSFYDADPDRLRTTVAGFLASGGAAGAAEPTRPFRALLLPHAGHVYSGAICGTGVGAVDWPGLVVLLGPNHTGRGDPFAIAPQDAWRIPLGDVPLDASLRDELLAAGRLFTSDAAAHEREHSLEVILPFLQVARPGVAILPISLGEPDLESCLEAGRLLAERVGARLAAGDRVALVASSDLSHYLSRADGRPKDDRALGALLEGDPAGFFDVVLRRERISMCGVLPATALLEALRRLGAGPARVVARGDSGDVSGDVSSVVGYAAVLWEDPAGTEEAS